MTVGAGLLREAVKAANLPSFFFFFCADMFALRVPFFCDVKGRPTGKSQIFRVEDC